MITVRRMGLTTCSSAERQLPRMASLFAPVMGMTSTGTGSVKLCRKRGCHHARNEFFRAPKRARNLVVRPANDLDRRRRGFHGARMVAIGGVGIYDRVSV